MKNKSSKTVAIYGMLTAAAMLFGYVEMLFPLDFIAPGIKLGIANIVPLLLVLSGKKAGAFLINIARILLTALLFGNAFSLVFSLTAGLLSVAAMVLVSKLKQIGVVGISVMGSTIHNVAQLAVALFVVGSGVLYYSPLLLTFGVITGTAIGIFANLIYGKILFGKGN